MSTPFKPTHSLRTILSETKDCSVIAVTAATGVPYERVHEIAKSAGRKDKKGFWSQSILRAMKDLNLLTFVNFNMYDSKRAKEIDYRQRENGFYGRYIPPYPTLAEVVRKFPSGRHVLETRNHAFAIVDGVIMDNRQNAKMRYRITDVFTVTLTPTMAQSDISAMWERLNRIEEKL